MHRLVRVASHRKVPVLVALVALTAGLLMTLQSASASPRTTALTKITRGSDNDPLCSSHASLCTDVYSKLTSEYVGHDEPSVEFKSSVPGSGNDMTYTLHAAEGPEAAAAADGSGGTWNFELRPTFWFGLTLCDTESAPEYTKMCTPDSDANDLVGTNPTGGLHRQAPRERVHGAAVLRPGLRAAVRGLRLHRDAVLRRDDDRQPEPRTRTPGRQNTPPATTTSSAAKSRSTGRTSRRAATRRLRPTRSSPARSPNPNFAAVNPDLTKDLLMNPGDRVTIHMHDTAAGFRIDLTDLTTGRAVDDRIGRQRLRRTSCSRRTPRRAHRRRTRSIPSTARLIRAATRGRRTPTTSRYSDEIGHFEHCMETRRELQLRDRRRSGRRCASTRRRRHLLRPGSDSPLIKINGCFVERRRLRRAVVPERLAGDDPERAATSAAPEPVMFTSPTTERGDQLLRRSRSRPTCRAIEARTRRHRRSATGHRRCVNPPPGAQFYPFFSDRDRRDAAPGRRAGRSSRGRSTTSAAARPGRVRPRSSPGLPRARGSPPRRLRQLQQRRPRQPVH